MQRDSTRRVHAFAAPCSHLTHFARPCDLYAISLRWGSFQAGADDPEEERDKGLEDDLAICEGSNFSIKRRGKLPRGEESQCAYVQMMEGNPWGLPSGFK
jgi:hypothetical protein